jgi:hypothetical protein
MLNSKDIELRGFAPFGKMDYLHPTPNIPIFQHSILME